jgi:pimeloyl-ACP methyl ester carboxylesterase
VRSLLLAAAACAALVLVPAAAAAQTPADCQTPNGARSLSRMAGELLAVGYGGPWDPGAVIAAYARTTGGAVKCGATPSAPTAPPARHDSVVFITGFQTSTLSMPEDFGLVRADLSLTQGFAPGDLLPWYYGVRPGAFVPDRTCQPIDASADQLAGTLRSYQAEHDFDGVILVGHSLGGVVALDVLDRAPDLTAGPQPFIRKVITIDSPVGGITGAANFLVSLRYGYVDCLALDDLEAIGRTAGGWAQSVASAALDRRVAIAVVANPSDSLIAPVAAQEIPSLAVNYVLDEVDSGWNHSAIVKTTDGAAQLAAIIGGQGQ